MRVIKVKRKCSVRGCKNTDCFAIVKGRELGGSVIMCADCLKEANEEVLKLIGGGKPLKEPKEESKQEENKKIDGNKAQEPKKKQSKEI